MENTEQDLANHLNYLLEINKQYGEYAKSVFEAGNSSIINIDFIVLAISNRAISLNKGFKTLMESENTLSAVNLLRLQLDNLIRYNSLYVATDDNYVKHILEGKPINQYVKNKMKFTDSNLAKELDKEFPNSFKLYVDMCEYIHFSITHIEQLKIKSDNPKAKYRVVVGDSDNFTLDQKIDFANSMVTVNNNLLSLLKNWPKEKNFFLGGINLI